MSPSKEPSSVPSTVPSITPSSQPSSQPSIHYEYGVAVCGATNGIGDVGVGIVGCPTHEEIIHYSTLRHVRCCSDEHLEGDWVWKENCSIYGATQNTGGAFADETTGHTGCSGLLNFYDAKAYCNEAGGRLCTSDELANDCTDATGCGYNIQMIWSSTAVVRFNIYQCYYVVLLPSSVLFTI